MKILFLVRHALYLRNFESTVRALADQGHEIMLVFSPLARQVDDTLALALPREYPNVTEQPIAPRTGWWWPASDGARALRDYLRYLEPDYDDAPALVERGGRRFPPAMRWLFDHVPGMKSRPVRTMLRRALTLLDRAIPPDPGAVEALRQWAPDIILVTPIVDFSYGQTEYVKAARLLGIPTVLAVASWDNLTNKGLIQIRPDRVLLWNAIQEREAVNMHGIPPERIYKTGAQLYDHWFEMSPSVDYAAFCSRVGGLDPTKPTILYLCSSSFVCKEEVPFVEEWLGKLRQSSDPNIRDANVVIRPHPQHGEQWRGVSLARFGRAVVWPGEGGAPLDEDRKRSYLDSLYHAGAVVGINTSGFIEAGILGKRTLTLATHHFRSTQEGTLHFHYLTQGGLLETAKTFDEHLSQLARALANPEETRSQVRAFITDFVRPNGIEKPATPILVEAILSAKNLSPEPWQVPVYAPLVRALFWPLAVPARRFVLDATNSGTYRGVERTQTPRYLPPERHSPARYIAETRTLTRQTYKNLAKIADSDRPIIVGPWLGDVGHELLYWIPMLRWAQETYNLDLKRLVVVSRGGTELWYGKLAHRYVDFFDLLDPSDYGKQEENEHRLLKAVQKRLDLGAYELLYPKLMFDGLFRHQWGQHGLPAQLLHHTRYLPLPTPTPGDIEARLPDDYYAVRFCARPGFTDSTGNRQFVRNMIDRLLDRADVILLDPPFPIDEPAEIAWMEATANGNGTNNRLIRAADWMTPRNTLDVQSRIIARSRGFAGTYGGLSYLAPFYGRPSIAFHQRHADVTDGDFSTAKAVFGAFDVPFMLFTPEDAKLLNEVL